MKKGIIGAVLGVVALTTIVAGTSNVPVSALSFFGLEIDLAEPTQPLMHPKSAITITSNSKLAHSLKTQDSLDDGCLQYSNHEYEVCVAYIFNASLADLLPYYTYTHSPNKELANSVSYRLDSRYTGQANSLLRSRVASWPSGNMDVGIPSIKILSIHANLTANTATLITEESWKVRTESGQVVFQETDVHHAITLQRVPSYLLHKWIVSSMQ